MPSAQKTGAGVTKPPSVQCTGDARRDRTPAKLEYYLRGSGAFFDHYTQRVSNWRRRDAGPTKAWSRRCAFMGRTGRVFSRSLEALASC
jgi:hypothetical protein